MLYMVSQENYFLWGVLWRFASSPLSLKIFSGFASVEQFINLEKT